MWQLWKIEVLFAPKQISLHVVSWLVEGEKLSLGDTTWNATPSFTRPIELYRNIKNLNKYFH
jgi:hypothetical protein